jgi:hypothetical protein
LALLLGCGPDAPPLLASGDSARGSLTQHDRLTADGRFVDDYRLAIGAGERVAVLVFAPDYNPMVVLYEGAGSASPQTRAVARGATLTPPGEPWTAFAQVRNRAADTLDVAIGSDKGAAVGRYTVEVRPLAPEAPAPPGCSALTPDGPRRGERSTAPEA